MFLCVLTGIMSICLWIFGCYHLLLIKKGLTSSERSKIGIFVEKTYKEFE